MIGKSIRWQLALTYAAIALLTAVALGGVLLYVLRDYYGQRELAYLDLNGRAVQKFVVGSSALQMPPEKLLAQLQSFAFLTQMRVRLIDPAGQLLADTGHPQDKLISIGGSDDTATRAGDVVRSVIYIRTIDGGKTLSREINENIVVSPKEFEVPIGPLDMLPLKGAAIIVGEEMAADGRRSTRTLRQPLTDETGAPLGYVELSEGPAYGSQILVAVARGWAVAGAVALLLAIAVGWLASRRISAPLAALTTVTGRMAGGDLAARAAVARRDELGRLAGSFNEMADQIEGTIVTLRRFVSDAAHEIHTPLTALRTNLELAASGTDGGEVQRCLERAQTQVGRLERLTNGLLDLSRIEAGAGQDETRPVELVELIRALAQSHASRAEQAGLAFTLDLPPAEFHILGRAEQLRGLVNNLVDNALKFTPAGGSVSVGLRQEGAQARLWVADTGIGILPQDLPDLFSRFHRGHNVAGYPGNGLGLAIVKAIAEGHGGRVAAESAGQGSRFTVWLPASTGPQGLPDL